MKKKLSTNLLTPATESVKNPGIMGLSSLFADSAFECDAGPPTTLERLRQIPLTAAEREQKRQAAIDATVLGATVLSRAISVSKPLTLQRRA